MIEDVNQENQDSIAEFEVDKLPKFSERINIDIAKLNCKPNYLFISSK